jgi:hypothetical protein
MLRDRFSGSPMTAHERRAREGLEGESHAKLNGSRAAQLEGRRRAAARRAAAESNRSQNAGPPNGVAWSRLVLIGSAAGPAEAVITRTAHRHQIAHPFNGQCALLPRRQTRTVLPEIYSDIRRRNAPCPRRGHRLPSDRNKAHAMPKASDDLEAVRAVVEAVTGFDATDQQRIFRWAAEKLGLPQPFNPGVTHVKGPTDQRAAPPPHPAPDAPPTTQHPASTRDVKSFVTEKNPRSAVQFAATIAYYFRFEALPSERKEAINKDDLLEACRKAGRERLADPYKALANAHTLV